ncbi:hypothetical protein BDQ17DRAFT_1434419 [Cyathus striatus]|nr:hypothetical protein BDQ17DRAFT_1434419 [Cyathus striatus]
MDQFFDMDFNTSDTIPYGFSEVRYLSYIHYIHLTIITHDIFVLQNFDTSATFHELHISIEELVYIPNHTASVLLAELNASSEDLGKPRRTPSPPSPIKRPGSTPIPQDDISMPPKMTSKVTNDTSSQAVQEQQVIDTLMKDEIYEFSLSSIDGVNERLNAWLIQNRQESLSSLEAREEEEGLVPEKVEDESSKHIPTPCGSTIYFNAPRAPPGFVLPMVPLPPMANITVICPEADPRLEPAPLQFIF